MQGSLLSPFEPSVAEMMKWKNAKMFQHLSLWVFVNHDFRFHDFGKSGYKGYLYPSEPPVAEMSKCRNVLVLVPLGFHVSRNQDTRSILVPWNLWSLKRQNVPVPYPSDFVNCDFKFHDFRKSSYKGYLCPLQPPVAEMKKCRKG
jgi:hypothetical protein